MPPRRSSTRTQQPAQRRPRIERACNFCRAAKLRCVAMEYGTNDRPCRRCISQGLDCNLPRVARSQSPSAGLDPQGPAEPNRNTIASHSAGGAAEELALGSETNIQHTLQQSESVQGPMRRWSPFIMHPGEQQGSSATIILPPGQTPLQTTSFLPPAPGMEAYPQSFSNIAQGSDDLESRYYSEDYYGTPDDTYMDNYATQSTSDGAPNLGYAQPDGAGSIHEQDHSGKY